MFSFIILHNLYKKIRKKVKEAVGLSLHYCGRVALPSPVNKTYYLEINEPIFKKGYIVANSDQANRTFVDYRKQTKQNIT